jgi:hypothetical protein
MGRPFYCVKFAYRAMVIVPTISFLSPVDFERMVAFQL